MKISNSTTFAALLLACASCSGGTGQPNGGVSESDDVPTTGQFPKRSNEPAPKVGPGIGNVPTNTTDYAPVTGNERPSPITCEGTWKCETNGVEKSVNFEPKLVGKVCQLGTVELLPNGRARTEKLGATGSWIAFDGVPVITFGATVLTCTVTTDKVTRPSK
jgi:hypothetical protein